MRKLTAKKVIKRYLRNRLLGGKNTVSSHHFETDVVRYGEMFWGVKHLPSAYSRAWRSLRQHNQLIDIDVKDAVEITTKSTEATWKLVKETT